ncbi:tRNA uridine 5-carboxymethylaminomethyl modification enzyme [Frankliniella fusca]|uniref:tRNA uridine 5-carboxymethylaminomethyl modification enzyme n=1 Tax=Frankliniella fusca TaxID=407009 RepID=A0AAE1HE30_9NEOP|nr:tRNA uridine 5-carboxymethylaminomethyl modification enzyme [Frankliniella fusca]
MDTLDVSGLAKILNQHGVDPEIINKLQTERINGVGFMKLTAELLRVLGFSGSDILVIIELQSKVEVLVQGIVEKNTAQKDSTAKDSVDMDILDEDFDQRGRDSDDNLQVQSNSDNEYNDETKATIDDALSKYIKNLDKFGYYEKHNMYGMLKRYENALSVNPSTAYKPWFVKDAENRRELQEHKSKLGESSRKVSVSKARNRESAGENSRSVERSISKGNERNADKAVENQENRGEVAREGMNLRKRKYNETIGSYLSKTSQHSLERGCGSQSSDNQQVKLNEETRNCSDSESWLNDEEGDDDDDDDDDKGKDAITAEVIDTAVKAFALAIPTEISSVKSDLPDFDILQILASEVKKLKSKAKRAFLNLLKNKWVSEQDRKCIIRILTRYLHFKHVENVSDVTSRMKEGMAKSFVCHFPKFASNLEGNSPWCHVFDPQGPKGWIQNSSRTIQKDYPRKQRKSKSKKEKSLITDYTSEEEIEYLSLLNTSKAEKREVLRIMAKTFPKRQEARRRGETITYFITKYIQFKNFDGEVLNEEFLRLHPNAKEMCKEFIRVRSKILELPAHREMDLKLDHSVVRCLMLISQHLPHDIPQKDDKWSNFTWAREEDIFVVIKADESVEDTIHERCELAVKEKRQVQPYLIVVKSQAASNKIYKIFLALDSQSMMLPTVEPLKGLDFLFKSMFVFNVKYPFGWRNVFHFLQTCLYCIFEKSNQTSSRSKWKDTVTSSEFELMSKLNQ